MVLAWGASGAERQHWDGDRVLVAASGIAVFIGGQGAVAEALAERIGVVQLGVERRETDLKAGGLKAGISKRQDGARGILKASAGLAWVDDCKLHRDRGGGFFGTVIRRALDVDLWREPLCDTAPRRGGR